MQAFGHAAASLCSGLEPELGGESARTGIEVALAVPDYLIYTACLGTLARAQLRLGDLKAATASIDQGMREVAERGFRGFLTAFLLQAKAELALLELARVRNRTTIASSRHAARGSLRLGPAARWHAVHARTIAGGRAWILGKPRRAERHFAGAEALADRYDWPGALADASAWVVHCCTEAGMETPTRLQARLSDASAAGAIAGRAA